MIYNFNIKIIHILNIYMNYFRINYHNENNNISIIILFLGNYFDNNDLTIRKLEKMLNNEEYEEFKPFMKKSEFNKIVT